MKLMKVYKFWCQPSSQEDNEILLRLIRLGAVYRKTLANVENRARSLQRAINDIPMRDVPVESRKTWRDEHKAELATWRKSDECKELLQTAREHQKRANIAARDQIVDDGRGLPWGCYQFVEEAFSTSCKTTPLYGKKGPNDVSAFVDYEEGSVSVHIQNRVLTVKKLMEQGDTFVTFSRERYSLGPRVKHFAPRADGDSFNRSNQIRPKRLQELKVRVGTNKDRTPKWARLHVLAHREMPDAAMISWVTVHRTRIATTSRWYVCVTVDEANVPSTYQIPTPVADRVGVDVGWRRVDGGTRVAYWVGSDGREGQFVIPDKVTQREGKSDDLQSIRGKNQNSAVDQLRNYLASVAGTWLADRAFGIHAWKRVERFQRLASDWEAVPAQYRLPNDQPHLDTLKAWLKQDSHLFLWERFNVLKQRRQTDAIVKEFALKLCREYGTIAIGDYSIADLVEKPEEIKDADAQWLRKLTAKRVHGLAPGALRSAFDPTAKKNQRVLLKLKVANFTTDCAQCGFRRDIGKDREADLILACEACGHAEDRDRTMSRNLLRVSAGETVSTPKKKAKQMGARRNRKKVVVADATVAATALVG